MALIKRIIKQFLYDKRTLGLILLAPLMILALINQVLDGEAHSPTIAGLTVPPPVSEVLTKAGAIVEIYEDREIAHEALLEGNADAILDMSAQFPSVTLEGSNPMISGAAIRLINTSLQKVKTGSPPVEVETYFVYGTEDMPLFDFGGPILIAFLSFFFVFLTAGVSFLRERSNGTLERLMGTPIKSWELVAGYIGGFGIFLLIQAIIITLFSVEALNMLMAGQMVHMIIITALVAVSALTLGMLLSTFVHNEFQIVQYVPVVIIPQLLFSGLFNLDAFPFWLRFMGYLMPVQYGVNALNQIMIRGKDWSYVLFEIGALLSFSIVFSIMNMFLLKRRG
jgi:ABC-2 type transport system permease protein